MSTDVSPRVSVIVNTVDRVDALRKLLAGLRQVRYDEFEVVVVVGPSSDGTDELLDEHSGFLRVLRCPVRNLSVSRNIGVRAAASDFVAFIDDDAVPEPSWLAELMAGFDTAEVAGVGGWVYDHTGHSFQCTHTGADRYGNARPDHPLPLDDLCVPGAWRFPYAPGGNGVYRRDLLMSVGGFDEEFEYYLEETDLCLRLIDRGWVIRQVDGGAIHHKFLPSGRRSADRVLRDRFAVVKNKVYFSIVNAADDASMLDILTDDVKFAEIHRKDAEWHREHGTASDVDVAASVESIERGWDAGLLAGLRGRRHLGFEGPPVAVDPDGFVPFPTIGRTDALRLCFISQTIPPTVIGGIGRYFLDLARELADRGHEVRIVTTGEGHPTVDLEAGVWIHRIPKPSADDRRIDDLEVPPRIAANAVAVADEVDRIAETGRLDAVYAAMWDVEQLAVLERRTAPVVTALVTTFGITLRTRPEWAGDEEFMEHFGTPLLGLERRVLDRSDHLHAISRAIVHDVEITAGPLAEDRLTVAPIGEADRFAGRPAGSTGPVSFHALFVGRFEKRKGVDLLLGALPTLLTEHPEVEVTLIGRNDLPGESGAPYWDDFEDAHREAPWFGRIHLLGEATDEVLADTFRRSDVLVAPSRFESFGLVYVEGMMAGIPVVAVGEGAATEVLRDGVDALIVEPASDAIVTAIASLVEDRDLGRRMGAAGRRRYEEEYTVGSMADRMERLFRSVSRSRQITE